MAEQKMKTGGKDGMPKPGEQLTLAQINRIRKQKQGGSAGKAPKATREALDKAIAMLPDGHTDPDYVVNGMRSHFGDLFTDEDEAQIRKVVVSGETKPSDGLTVEQLREALTAKGVEIPADAKKADLQKLLDEA